MNGYKTIFLILSVAALMVLAYFFNEAGMLRFDALARFLDPEFWSVFMERVYRGIYG
jgi:hypothetical protein